jgi:hypothetical protein
MKEQFTPKQLEDLTEADEVAELELAGKIADESFQAEWKEESKEAVETGIQNLLDFCQAKKDEPLWPNGPTGEQYINGLVRVNPDGTNRGSFVEGLDTIDKTIDFLKQLEFTKVEVSPDIQFGDCHYYQASVPEGYDAFTGVLTVEEARNNGIDIKIEQGAHGDELVGVQEHGKLPRTKIISVIIDGGMLSTWYPGEFTAGNPDPEQKLPTNPEHWNENWAVKIQQEK